MYDKNVIHKTIPHSHSRLRAGRCAWVPLVLCLSAQGAMACDAPVFNADIPNGKTASEAEMGQAQAAVKEYVSAGEAYIACLENQGMGGSSTYINQRNATIDEMEKVAALFNRQLRHYRKNS